MKKGFLITGLLLAGMINVYAQVTSAVESSSRTGYGLLNGALTSTAGGNTYFGYRAGSQNTTGNNNVFTGFNAGYSNTTGSANTFTGWWSGYNNNANFNTFYGYNTGRFNTTGADNTFTGSHAGYSNTIGIQNTNTGRNAGFSNATGNDNINIGFNAGHSNTAGSNNLILGTRAGFNNLIGSNNIFLGYEAGINETGSNKFYVGIGTNILMYGDSAAGKLAIGGMTTFPSTAGSVNVSNYKLFVKGGILTEEVRINLATGWADYVFAEGYKLPSLLEVEKYIAANGHLPNVPSAKQVKEDGIELGQMANIQQEKIEELTLYAIEQNKQIETQKSQLEQQQKEIDELKAAVKALTSKQ